MSRILGDFREPHQQLAAIPGNSACFRFPNNSPHNRHNPKTLPFSGRTSGQKLVSFPHQHHQPIAGHPKHRPQAVRLCICGQVSSTSFISASGIASPCCTSGVSGASTRNSGSSSVSSGRFFLGEPGGNRAEHKGTYQVAAEKEQLSLRQSLNWFGHAVGEAKL